MRKKGLSMIVLIITIVVVVIISTVTIIALSNNNIIGNASESVFKENATGYRDEFTLHKSKLYVNNSFLNKEDINYGSDKISQAISSIVEEDKSKFTIFEGEFYYIGKDKDEIKWAKEVNIPVIEVEEIEVVDFTAEATFREITVKATMDKERTNYRFNYYLYDEAGVEIEKGYNKYSSTKSTLTDEYTFKSPKINPGTDYTAKIEAIYWGKTAEKELAVKTAGASFKFLPDETKEWYNEPYDVTVELRCELPDGYFMYVSFDGYNFEKLSSPYKVEVKEKCTLYGKIDTAPNGGDELEYKSIDITDIDREKPIESKVSYISGTANSLMLEIIGEDKDETQKDSESGIDKFEIYFNEKNVHTEDLDDNVSLINNRYTFEKNIEGLDSNTKYSVYVKTWDRAGNYTDSDVIYPQTEKAQYVITYDANGGTTSLTTQAKIETVPLSLPDETKIARNGYTFGGWKSSADNKVYAAGESYNVDANATLTAQWTPIVYNISYELNGGTLSQANPVTYTIESEDITLNNPTKTGYIFTGWTGSNGNTPQTEVIIPKGSTQDKSYIANWIEETYTLTINHYFENANDTKYVLSRTTTTSIDYGTDINLADFRVSITNGTYDYGSLTASTAGASSAKITTTTIKGDTTIALYYKRNTYTLTVTKGNYISAVTGGGIYKVGASVKLTATLAQEAGYTTTWSSWSSSNTNLVGNTTVQNPTITMPAGNVTMTANATREAIMYTLTIEHYLENANNTSYTKARTTTASIDYGTTVTLANYKATITNGTYDYGSLTASTAGASSAKITTTTMKGDTKIALYYKRNTYTLTVAKGNYISAVTGGGIYKVGASVNLTATVSETAGYTTTWSGWTSSNTSLLANNTTQNPTITMPAGNVTMTANATREAIMYTLTIEHYLENANNTSYTKARTTTASIDYGTTVTLANYKATITNGTYDYGSLTASTAGAASSKVTTTKITADTKIALYYKRSTYTLTVAKGNYISAVTGGGIYKVGASVNLTATLAQAAGYTTTWSRWTSSNTSLLANNTTQNPTITMPAGNVTMTANATRKDTSGPTPTLTYSNVTATSFTLTASATDASGIASYSFYVNNKLYKTEPTTATTFSIIIPKSAATSTTYEYHASCYVIATDGAGNSGAKSNVITIGKTTTAPSITSSPTGTTYTNGNATVTITAKTITGYTLQYKIGATGSWTPYSQAFTVSSNCTIYARYYNSTLNNEEDPVTHNVTNVDTLKPATATLSYSNVTNSGFTLSISAADAAKTSASASSGIAKYTYYYRDYGTSTWTSLGTITSTSKAVNLTGAAELAYGYSKQCMVRVYDKAGNYKDSNIVTISKANAKPTITFNPSGYTSGSVVATAGGINTLPVGFTLQISQDGKNWTPTTASSNKTVSTTVTTNKKTVYARLYNIALGVEGEQSTKQVTLIDTVAPVISSVSVSSGPTGTGFTMKCVASDPTTGVSAASGIKNYTYKFRYKRADRPNDDFSGWQTKTTTSATFTFTASSYSSTLVTYGYIVEWYVIVTDKVSKTDTSDTITTTYKK